MRELAAPHRHLTIDEYLALESASEIRHEYVGGMLYAMAGATQRHNRIAMNVAAQLWNGARGTDCAVYGSDMLVRIGDNACYYPDAVVVCDPADEEPMYLTQPCLIVEVSSPSTASADRRDKLMGYCAIESLQEYLIVFQDEQRVIRHFRDQKGAWWHEELAPGRMLHLRCPEMLLNVAEIYEGVDFSEA
ncbi:MAG: Uma2 family endonuclease [Chloroflexi bacterium]|nr:MAG: Uma2 family endonuclease [Chloroflexota bacterium]